MNKFRVGIGVSVVLGTLLSACSSSHQNFDATSTVGKRGSGRPVLSMFWRRSIADFSGDPSPQEFASPAVYLGSTVGDDQLFLGSRNGWFYALNAVKGSVLWKKKIGAVSGKPLVYRGRIYVGTDDGIVMCFNILGQEQWRYKTSSPILQAPIVGEDALLIANENDEVYSLDLQTGAFRWQYSAKSSEEYTLRGHAGLSIDGDLIYAGFSDGSVVALRSDGGSVAWISSLRNGEDRFVDVDTTPVIRGDLVLAASSAGGLFAMDKTTGRIRWSRDIAGGGGLVANDHHIFFVAAELGIYAMDMTGHVLWRQGLRGGGEPSQPLLLDEYIFFSLSEDGLFVADVGTGEIVQYLDPGFGISSEPTSARRQMYVLSNGSFLYSLGIEDT